MHNKTSRILVVDDDAATRELFSEVLISNGYEIQGAGTGREALELARSTHPEIVLLDVGLPDMSGLEVCRLIKSDHALLDVFVVLVSGQATSTADKVGGLDTGADDYIPKPIDLREFLARIRTIVRLHDATAALRSSEQHYRRLVDILPDAVSLVDLQGCVTQANHQAAVMLGFSNSDDLVGKTILGLFSPEERERVGKDLETALRSGSLRTSEYTMLRKDGRQFPAEVGAVVLSDSKGEPLGLVALGRDITARKRTQEELRQLSRLVIEAQETERLRVARELHDGVNQILASAKMRLCKVNQMLAGLHPAAGVILERCHELLIQALEENRRIAHNLRPTTLDDLGLAEACRNFCKEVQSRADIDVKCGIAELDRRLAPNIELNVFRIVQEALRNIEKHARARSAWLEISIRDGRLEVKIQDDGRGFNVQGLRSGKRNATGIGLTNMRERVASLGGVCDILSERGRGTTITLSVPCRAGIKSLPAQEGAPSTTSAGLRRGTDSQPAPVSTQHTA